jgi:hypothetical protein
MGGIEHFGVIVVTVRTPHIAWAIPRTDVAATFGVLAKKAPYIYGATVNILACLQIGFNRRSG